MMYVISESKLNSVIYKFLDRNYYPDYDRDYSWGPELYKVLDKELETYGYISFFINDNIGYVYIGTKHITGFKDPNSLYVAKSIEETLSGLFGDMWKPVMAKWFSDNTGWNVENINSLG